MMRDLFNNTLLSALAFFVSSLLGLLVIPLIVHHWGMAAYGLIVLARLFIPQGMAAIFDFGLPEISTQAVARARINQDWAKASQTLGFLAAIGIVAGLLAGAGLYLTVPLWLALFKVSASEAGAFSQILTATALAALPLFPILIAEGILKGFERFAALRALEVLSTLVYVSGAALAVWLDLPFQSVAFVYLAALLARYIAMSALALGLSRKQGLSMRLPQGAALRKELARYCLVMTQAKIIGTLQSQLMPFLAGAFFGAKGTATFDLLVRLPRFAKMALSVFSTSVLPVSAKLDEMGTREGISRLGRIALVLLPAVTVPPLAGAALLSEPILKLWIGDEISRLWPWMAIMFAVPVQAQYSSFGSVVMMARRQVQVLLNSITFLQVLIMLTAAFAGMSLLQERAFVLALALASLAVLPAQLWVLASEMKVSRRVAARTAVFQLLTMAAGAVPMLALVRMTGLTEPAALVTVFALWCLAIWGLEYRFLLTDEDRTELERMGRAVAALGRRIGQAGS